MNNSLPPALAVHRLPLYNTARLKDDEVIAAFAVRTPLLERILADIAGETQRSRAQQHLIVGQRGMGKTMLLARLAASLRTAPLEQHFIPLVFAEEQYSVDRISKFWINCLDSLADARERAGIQSEAKAIDQTVRRLESRLAQAAKNETQFANETLDAFLAAAEVTQRRPVLLVDNLQIVFERLDSQQQHVLREVLMRPGSPILIGASPSPPPESQDYRAAFYDQFKVYYLSALSLEEMRSLLVHLAKIAQRDDVRDRVLREPERLAVLRQLTGGNPRTTLMLFFLYAEDFSPNVFGDLENLLDRVTPLYKTRFEELPPQQQVVASAIANHWDPATSRDVCEATGLAQNQVSPQLDRLEKIGFIEKVELFEVASTGFQIAERFFNVWYLMRSASRRQRRQVEFLTRFLESFYEASDRDWLRLGRYEEAESAYRQAIQLDPKNSLPWNGLGNLYCDYLQRYADAEKAFAKATELDPRVDSPVQNQIFLRRDFLGEVDRSRQLLTRLRDFSDLQSKDTLYLHEALFAAYDANWGIAREKLTAALEQIPHGLPPNTHDDWLRASAVLLHLNYGAELLTFLEERGEHERLRPWFEALRALQHGDRRLLQNVAAEVRPIAETFYDGIARRLAALPPSTGRRPVAPKARTKRKGSSRK